MPDTTTLDKPITTRRARQRKLAELVLAGERPKAIALKMGIVGKYPTNAVCNRVNDKGTQEQIAQIRAETGYTVAQCLEELNEALALARKKGHTVSMINAAMSKAKVQGLLIDKVQDVTVQDRGKVRAEADAMLSALTVSDAGIVPDSQKVT